MKKRIALFLCLVLCLSFPAHALPESAVSLPTPTPEPEPAYLWDVPFGLPLPEAVATLESKLGIHLTFDFTASRAAYYVPLTVQGLVCDVRMYAEPESEQYNELSIYNRLCSTPAFTQEDVDYLHRFYPQTVSLFVSALTRKLGEPLESGLYLRDRNDELKRFDIPMQKDQIDLAALLPILDFFGCSFRYRWSNAELTFDYSPDRYYRYESNICELTVIATSDEREPLPDESNGNVFGYLEWQRLGVTEF